VYTHYRRPSACRPYGRKGDETGISYTVESTFLQSATERFDTRHDRALFANACRESQFELDGRSMPDASARPLLYRRAT
jgi:hypothetical protein